MFRVMIIDPEAKSSDTLKKMLKNRLDVELLGAYSDIKNFLKEFVSKTTDVVFIWLATYHYNGIHLARAICKSCPNIKIIFFSNNNPLTVESPELKSVNCLFFPFNEDRVNATMNSILKPVDEKVFH